MDTYLGDEPETNYSVSTEDKNVTACNMDVLFFMP